MQDRVYPVQLFRFSILCFEEKQESSLTPIFTLEPTSLLKWSHIISLLTVMLDAAGQEA